ncbi:hypothetical protein MPER_09444, partial [Moniliophthora perniciosa FA553]
MYEMNDWIHTLHTFFHNLSFSCSKDEPEPGSGEGGFDRDDWLV